MSKKKAEKEIRMFIYSAILGICLSDAHYELKHSNYTTFEYEFLETYYNGGCDFDDVKNTIDNNENLSPDDKERIKKVVDKLEQKTPYIDLSCFNENCKNLTITREKEYSDGLLGFYTPATDTITLRDDRDIVFNHEVLHMLNNFCEDWHNKKYIKTYSLGQPNLMYQVEGFNEWFNNYLFGKSIYYYQKQANYIEIIKNILNLTDKQLIMAFTNGNYTDIMQPLTNISKEILNVNKILEKEKENYKDELTDKEKEQVINTFMDMYLSNHDNKNIDNNTYQFLEEMCRLYSYYNIENDDSYKVVEFRKESLAKIADVMNKDNQKPLIYSNYRNIEYLDIDNLYLVCIKLSVDNYDYYLAEKYEDKTKKQVIINGTSKVYLESNKYDDQKLKTTVDFYGRESVTYVNDIIPVSELITDKNDNVIFLDNLVLQYEQSEQKSKVLKK